MEFPLKLRIQSRNRDQMRTRIGAASTSIGAACLSLSIAMPASAIPEPAPTALDDFESSYSDRLTKLRALQAGARRAQMERLQAQRSAEQTQSASANLNFSSGDGIYLYGEQPAYDQSATAYFVFETNAGSVTGAFYTPASSFDCAQGRINSNSIQLAITDSYSQERHSYALGLTSTDVPIASGHSETLPQSIIPQSIEQRIDGYYPLPVRDSDRVILATCQAQSQLQNR